MTVTLEGNRLKVVLDQVETVQYGVDCVFFDKASATAKWALAMLLKVAGEKCSYCCGATEFLIELYPTLNGGCEILYIPQAQSVQPKRLTKRVNRFEFRSSEALLAGLEALYRDKSVRYCTSAVYKIDKKYLLSTVNLTAKAVRLLTFNFADRVLRSNEPLPKAAVTVCPKNAIAIIGSALCHESFD